MKILFQYWMMIDYIIIQNKMWRSNWILYIMSALPSTKFQILSRYDWKFFFPFFVVCTKIYSTTIELAVICNLVSLVKLGWTLNWIGKLYVPKVSVPQSYQQYRVDHYLDYMSIVNSFISINENSHNCCY